MATTTNYGWETPDDTDLVKDGASAIRTLGSSIDTTTKALNPETTLGDISYRSSTANTNTRLALGTAGQVLTVNSGATAPEWAAPSGKANWTLLNAGGTALTGAQTVTVSSISGKDKIMVIIDQASSASQAYIGIRLNTDTGSNYYEYGQELIAESTYAANTVLLGRSNTNTYIAIGRMNGSTSSVVSGTCLITGCDSAGVKIYQMSGGGHQNTSQNGQRLYNSGGYYNSASTISSVSIFSNTGNLDAGTVYVYASAQEIL